MKLLNLDAFRRTPLIEAPFEHCVTPDFVRTQHQRLIERDFPEIRDGGSFPCSSLKFGDAFSQLAEELLSPELRDAFSEHFRMDLRNRPATLTVRGMTRAKDGQIHLDSKTKLITVLVYLNSDWGDAGGQLRLLRSPTDIEDVVTEIPPHFGSMVAFRCRPNAWHGHKPYVGVRRALQLNWVTDASAARTNVWRHSLSCFLKRLRLAS